MNYATTCKFCKKEIVLQIADDYDLSDPHKLIPMAACNRCADLRVRRRRLEDGVKRIASEIIQVPSGREKHRDTLRVLTQSYAKLISDWIGAATPAWDIACVDLIIDQPDAWGKSLAQLWKLYR